MREVAVTGATGFIGSQLVPSLQKDKDLRVRSLSFSASDISQIDLNGVDVVIHLAGIAHRMEPTPDDLYFAINQRKTMALAKKAKECGVGHFVFMSTIKVYGVESSTSPINEHTPCEPGDAYGRSKLLAENALSELVTDNFRVTSIRTPVVHGPGVKGNIRRLLGLINSWPVLPFGGIDNQRSMIGIANLTAYVKRIVQEGYSGTVLPSDPTAISTTELVNTISKYLNKSNDLSLPLLEPLAKTLFPRHWNRLFASLIVDSTSTNKALDFEPPISTEDGLKEMMQWYLSTRQ